MTTPLAAYNFDESGNTVLDYSVAGGQSFSIAGASVTRVAGHTGSGLRATGTETPSLPDIGRTDLRTIMAWISFSGIQNSWPIIFNVPSLDSGGWGILYLAPNIVIQARNSSGFARASAAWPADGQPHHVAGTYDGTSIRLYLDGALQGTPTALAGPLRTDTNPPVLWAGTGAMASGYIDDVRIYDAVRSDAEIVTDMNTPVDVIDEGEPEEPPPTPVPVESGGWATLLETARWNAAELDRERTEPPVACPTHGEPLDVRSDGARNCPFGDYRYT